MSRTGSSFLLALAFVSLALAGCITPPDQLDAASAAPPAVEGATPAVVHRAVGAQAEEVAAADLDELLAGVPLPAGTLRVSPMSSFEPTLGITSDGTVFLSTFEPTVPDWRLLQRTRDQGLTWEDVTPRVAGVTTPPQSNDPYVYVDPDTDRIFLSDLQMLVCSTLSFSDGQGDSWTTNPIGCGHPFGVQDHQTVFTGKPRVLPTVGYPNIVYYCINRVVDSTCATSLNGGLSFGPLRPLVYQGVEPQGVCGGLHAHGATGPDGTVYLPKGHCGQATVAISQDDGLTWTHVVISDTVAVPGHEVAFAVDEAGNTYAFWIGDDRLPYLAASADGGFTWNEPVMVAPPGVGTTDFPTIAAGADGRVAVAYYGTAREADYADMDSDDLWNGYITIVTDATSEAPLLMTVTANDPADPLARGVCGGSRCNGVGDFIDIVIDPEGRPWAALVDVCSGACAEADGSANEGSFGAVGTLAAGPRLRGETGALPPLTA